MKAQDNALLLVRSLAAQQEQITIATKTMLRTLAQLPEVQRLDVVACGGIFIELNRQYPFYSEILAATPDGQVFAASLPYDLNTNLADQKHIKEAIRTLDFSVGGHVRGRVSNAPSLHYAFPVLDTHKKLVAILDAGFDLNEFAQFISTVKLPEGSTVAFTDHQGVRLYRLPQHEATPIGEPVPKVYFEAISSGAEEGLFEWQAMDGINRLWAFKQMRLKGNSLSYMHIGVGLPKDRILHEANRKMWGNLSLLMLAVLLALSLAWIVGNEVVIKPINRLVTATQQFGQGDMDIRTGLPHTHDEIGLLAQSFDDMAALLEKKTRERQKAEESLTKANAELEGRVQERTAELSTTNAALLESEQKLVNIIDFLPDATFVIDTNGKVIAWNKAIEEMTGVIDLDMVGKGDYEYALPF